jgi:hypothetical protein
MRTSIHSVAVISLFTSNGRAFAPPRTPASSSSSSARRPSSSSSFRLRAASGNDLAGLLREYSGSAAASSAAASDAATMAEDKVAIVPSSAAAVIVAPPLEPPPPPPPPMEIIAPPPPANVAESTLDAVASAAAAAQDAADQAAAAAAAIAVKGAAATKAATTAAASAGAAAAAFQLPLRPLVGGVFVPSAPSASSRLPFQVDPAKVDATNAFDASARARENLAIIKANFLGGIRGIADATSSVFVDIPTVGGSASSTAVASTFAAAIASLHLREYGGWYAAVLMGVIALNQRSKGREDATAAYESELAVARERASKAAAAAGLAAEGAKTAKMLAMKMERDMTKDGGKALLESSRSKMAEVEKASVIIVISHLR